MIDTLTDRQLEIHDDLITRITDNSNDFFLLTGPAGSGKTYLTITIIDTLVTMFDKIGVGATTNKALKILFNQTNQSDKKVLFKTIHSLLGLTENIDGYGKVTFKRKKHHSFNYPIRKNKIKLVIIDEISQLADDVWEYILQEIQYGVKFIFIGDKNQTPPVNKLDSMPLLKNIQQDNNIHVMALTEIIRQQKDSPIIDLAFRIKSDLTKKFVKFKEVRSDNGNVVIVDKENFETQLNLLSRLFNSSEFKRDSDFAKIACWTNAAVNEYNDVIRSLIYEDQDDLPKINIGEKLIVDAPVIGNINGQEVTILHTNEEIEVKGYEIKNNEHITVADFSKPFKYYHTEVENKKLNGTINTNYVKILHEDSEGQFKVLLNKIVSLAKKQKQGSQQASYFWKLYFRYKNHFAQIKYNYALTVHKVQGSTYENCIVNYPDIMLNKRVIERMRILYTATTRPSKNLFILK